MAAAGVVLASTRNWWLLILAGTIGVISPSGNEVGPFLPVEQAALAEVIPDRRRTEVFAWYTLVGAVATASGSLFAGLLAQTSGSERAIVLEYVALGLGLALVFSSTLTGSGSKRGFWRAGTWKHSTRPGTVAGDRVEAVGAIWNGFVRRRFRGAELCGVLVLFTFRSEARDARRNLLRSEPARWRFGAGGLADRIAHRLDPDDGIHASAIERFAVTGPPDAKRKIGDRDVTSAIQYQSDGCADQDVLHNGGSR
jgi:MFS family permease